MKWFKHYSSLGDKDFSQSLIREQGLEAYARYMLLLELCASRHGDRLDGKYSINKHQLASKLVAKPQLLRSKLAATAQLMGFNFTATAQDYNFDIPILAELRHKDSVSYKKRRASGGPVAGLEKEEEKEKDIMLKQDLSEKWFNEFYAAYPRKQGKSPGKRKFISQIKTLESREAIWSALKTFIAHHKARGTEAGFLPYFSSFMNTWRDCLDPDFGKTQSFAKPKHITLGIVPR